VLDKLQSLYQGRPARLYESGTNLPMEFLDKHEELELFNPLSYTELSKYPMSPVYSISVFVETCKLSVILDKILLSLYAEKSMIKLSSDLLQARISLHSEIEKWRNSLPQHLDIKFSDTVAKVSLPNTLTLLYALPLNYI
jgi:hypothetical protein